MKSSDVSSLAEEGGVCVTKLEAEEGVIGTPVFRAGGAGEPVKAATGGIVGAAADEATGATFGVLGVAGAGTGVPGVDGTSFLGVDLNSTAAFVFGSTILIALLVRF